MKQNDEMLKGWWGYNDVENDDDEIVTVNIWRWC